MPIVEETRHEIRIFRMRTSGGIDYAIQVERPNKITTISAKGLAIPLSQEDVAELWDTISCAGLWATEQADNPLVPRV